MPTYMEKPPLSSMTIDRKNNSPNHLLTPTKSKHQVQGALLLNIVVR